MSSFQILKRLVKYIKPYQSLFWLSALIAILMAPFNAILPYLTNIMVDDYILVKDLHGLKIIAVWYLVILIGLTL